MLDSYGDKIEKLPITYHEYNVNETAASSFGVKSRSSPGHVPTKRKCHCCRSRSLRHSRQLAYEQVRSRITSWSRCYSTQGSHLLMYNIQLTIHIWLTSKDADQDRCGYGSLVNKTERVLCLGGASMGFRNGKDACE